MKALNYPRLFFGALAMAVVFMIAEFVVEGIAMAVFGVSEEKFLQGANLTLSGSRYYIVNILYFYSFCCLAMWLYVSLLPKYGAPKQGALATVIFLMTLIFLAATNLVNIGLIPFATGLTSLVFNVLELTPAIFVGATVYSSNRDAGQVKE